MWQALKCVQAITHTVFSKSISTLLLSVFISSTVVAQQDDLDLLNTMAMSAQNQSDSELASEIETLQQALVNLNRDLFVLEEDLLFPSSTQMAVYLSMDVGQYFALDSIEIKINDKTISHYLYTEKQVNALVRGGVHRVYVGNINQGEHQITALFHGLGPEDRPYKRAVTLPFNKTDEAKAIELQIIDSTRSMQPEFVAISL